MAWTLSGSQFTHCAGESDGRYHIADLADATLLVCPGSPRSLPGGNGGVTKTIRLHFQAPVNGESPAFRRWHNAGPVACGRDAIHLGDAIGYSMCISSQQSPGLHHSAGLPLIKTKTRHMGRIASQSSVTTLADFRNRTVMIIRASRIRQQWRDFPGLFRVSRGQEDAAGVTKSHSTVSTGEFPELVRMRRFAPRMPISAKLAFAYTRNRYGRGFALTGPGYCAMCIR